ncbi:MAG TPA: SDR family NAD(P)-dependent oxidoreductase [Dehalococcoidia bacterium]|nr:SDR family NAD(P)-dependent oxidoreductase [Dehalococcoidia bacterium]
MRLQEKVAVITGSGGGQGRAAARLFAAEGAQVVVTDVNESGIRETIAEIQGTGGTALAVPADVSDEESVRDLMQEAIRQFGRIDILYNNAGIAPFDDQRFETMDVAVWDRIHNVNLRGLFFCCKHAIPSMIDQNAGSIINTASIAGLIGIGGQLAYSAAKAGVIGLTKATATTYGRHNIRCNAICPGAVETPMTAHLLEQERIRQAQVRLHAIRRLGTPEDIANLALYLAGDESSWMTGAVIPIDGGWTNR